MLRAPPVIAMSVGDGLISNPATVWPTTAFIAADMGGPSIVVDWRESFCIWEVLKFIVVFLSLSTRWISDLK